MEAQNMDEQLTEDQIDAWGRGPEYKVAFWDFVSAVESETAVPSDLDFLFASHLAGMFREMWIRHLTRTKGDDRTSAAAAYSAMVEGERAIYGSLAAGEDQVPGDPE
jgi:hypothetical protein